MSADKSILLSSSCDSSSGSTPPTTLILDLQLQERSTASKASLVHYILQDVNKGAHVYTR
ncbi:hypothetical protein PCANC_10975 [Puccinia coronata f. sp. avenae]|uniref:Uncharacterized protein n=1 Tax=Puccinia coronata f. sp. avenae TaxID=200324 RepID=A0A2N5RV67_9BASI|nr:hypothetical protein PCANC_28225 [Puccinia coronata f. sp. avenae]PLW42120.1 hypothetical protein PCANC_10975 [Puccinia coronata f. sp. avenae]